jgi:DNA-binding LacI/PurR family transcriptional regulator
LKCRSSVSLKQLSEHLHLSQGTVSMALSPNAESTGVAVKTRERVLRAAKELNYRPNFYARSLSSGRSFTIGVVVPAISEGYYSTVIAGIEHHLMQADYFFLVTSHRWNHEKMEQLPKALMSRGAEGLILVNTIMDHDVELPSVRIGGSKHFKNSINVRLDEELGASLALEHLVSLGHRKIALFKGEAESTATEERWEGIEKAAKSLKIKISKERVVELKLHNDDEPIEGAWDGYSAAQILLSRKTEFTALFAYNDSTAIGAMRAFADGGVKLPREMSVVGYDDIPAAQYERPALTTVRQPLLQMGEDAAQVLLERIAGKRKHADILVKPTLIVRGSTARAS